MDRTTGYDIEQDLLDLMVEYLCEDHSNDDLISLAKKAIQYSLGD